MMNIITIMIGVKTPKTLVILSKFINDTVMIKSEQINPPTQKGNPNCCSKFEPAPAIITNPIIKLPAISTKSSILVIIGWEICVKTSS